MTTSVFLFNATNTSGGTGPGVVTIPDDEAAALIEAGYAVIAGGEGDD